MTKKKYREWKPAQQFLVPPSMHDWLPEEHPVYFVLDLVGKLDISAIEEKYEAKDPRGERPYSPRMMVGLLLYGYSVGIRSSRKLEKATYEDIPFRVLCAGNHPDHTRISEFRRKHLDELEELFLQIFKICQRAGLVELGNLALDGTKVQANASKHKAMSYERMLEESERLKAEIQQMLEEAESVDEAEDTKFGRDSRGDELPDQLQRRRDRLAKIEQAKAELEKETRQARAEQLKDNAERAKQRAETHESQKERRRSATMAENYGKQAEQLSREAGNQLPEATTPEGMPKHRPKTETDGTPKPKAQRNFTDPDSRILEKNGEFLQGYNGQLVVDEAYQVIVAQGLTNQSPDNGNFGPMVDKAVDNAGRPPDAVLADSGYWQQEAPKRAAARGCEAFIATKKQPHGKKKPTCFGVPPEGGSAIDKMSHRVRTPEGLKRYARRKAIVEPVNGQIKEIGGFRRFHLRGFDKARKEWALVCTGHNLKKLCRAYQVGDGNFGFLG